MRYINCLALSAVDTTSANGVAIDANQLISASFQMIFGDTSAVGVFSIQGSNDTFEAGYTYPNGTFTPTNWTTIPNASTAIAAGASSYLVIPNCTFRWMRAVYTSTSGGSSTVIVNMNALSM